MKAMTLRTALLAAALLLALPLRAPAVARAATSPSLGTAGTFAGRAAPPVGAAAASVSAWLTIPRLGVSAPIDERGLDARRQMVIAPGYAVTHYRYSAALGARGNAVLYGHDDIDGAVFRPLAALRPGDTIIAVAGGWRATYVVTGRRVVAPDDIAVLRPTPGATVTLITCTPYGIDTQRLVVTGVLRRATPVA